jgi:hypothetical protein
LILDVRDKIRSASFLSFSATARENRIIRITHVRKSLVVVPSETRAGSITAAGTAVPTHHLHNGTTVSVSARLGVTLARCPSICIFILFFKTLSSALIFQESFGGQKNVAAPTTTVPKQWPTNKTTTAEAPPAPAASRRVNLFFVFSAF